MRRRLSRFKVVRQRGVGLGERLESAFWLLLQRHSSVVVIGTDSPELRPGAILQALEELRWCEAVLGPCPDGGYYLLGLRRGLHKDALTDLFRGIRWDSRWALMDTLKNMMRLRLSCSVIESCADVDRPHDVERLFRRMSGNSWLRRRAPETWRFLSTCPILKRDSDSPSIREQVPPRVRHDLMRDDHLNRRIGYLLEQEMHNKG